MTSRRTGSLYWLTEVTHRSFSSMAHKMTMLVLARYIDEEDCCYPSQRTLAASVGVSERKIRGLLAELEIAALISREHRNGPDGHRTSDLICLDREALDALPEVDSQPAFRAARSRPPSGTKEPRLAANSAPPSGTCVPDNQPGVEPTNTEENHQAEPDGSAAHEQLCQALADRIGRHGKVQRPAVTEKWRRDMRLLCERGPLHVERPEPLPVERVAAAIEFVFDRLADPQGTSGFCWADQVRSPGALRDHWVQLLVAARRAQQPRAPQGRAAEQEAARRRIYDQIAEGFGGQS